MWVLCARHDIKQRRLAIYHKSEFGESKRGHIHFLIAQQSIPLTPSQLAASLTNIWRLKGKGLADIVSFDSTRHLRGIDYQSKVESDESGHPLFSNDVFSPALQRRFRANAGLIQLV
jgi:hypothetical protein